MQTLIQRSFRCFMKRVESVASVKAATSEPWPIKAGVINQEDVKEEVSRPLIHNAAAPISASILIMINRNTSLIFRSGDQPPRHPGLSSVLSRFIALFHRHMWQLIEQKSNYRGNQTN